MEIAVLPVAGVEKITLLFVVKEGWQLKNPCERSCFQNLMPATTAKTEWGAKICAIFVRAVFVVFG